MRYKIQSADQSVTSPADSLADPVHYSRLFLGSDFSLGVAAQISMIIPLSYGQSAPLSGKNHRLKSQKSPP